MNWSDGVHRKQSTNRKRTWQWIAAVLLSVIVLITGTYWLFEKHSLREFDRVKEAIRAAGNPVTYEELDHYYDLGPGPAESGNTLVRAFTRYNGRHTSSEDPIFIFGAHPAPGNGFTAESIEATRQFVAQNRSLVEEVDSLLHVNAVVRFPLTMPNVLDEDPPHYEGIRAVIRLLLMDSLLAGIDGDATTAADRICTAYALADSLKHEPLLVSQLVRAACVDITTRCLETICSHSAFDANQLESIQQSINQVTLEGCVARGLIGERCILMLELNRRAPDRWSDILFAFQAYRNRECVYLARDYDTWIGVGALPYLDRVSALREYQMRVSQSLVLTNTNARILGSSIELAYGAEARNIAKLRTAATALAVLRFYRIRGKLPTDIEALIPEYQEVIPADPFDGKSLRYRVTEKGFIIYALGEDGDDDGGIQPKSDESLQTAGDVLFSVVEL